ncbi:hypothetical protein BDA99DRAFT_608473 [Phascolomyces articulosus]|uniref:Heterokaryon incompatibility domain-containing protein n=1 Tax=Phascolomyces articulosus TaxID=60185 RepID=A0AAD5JQS1_9FUNG|nr:hypothetical protein BDA99DRAFT_608473 [Phascolomyces articulosus]
MYITYETTQYSLNDRGKSPKFSQPPKKVPNDLPKPDFMPTKLVRISDTQVVDGSQVNEGYCALSYSWNQSGEIQQDDNGEYIRVDEGKHEIISYSNVSRDMMNRELSEKHRKIFEDIIDDKISYFTKTIKHVKFEGIIQQICQQFNIKYIWYDQLCINQDNDEEKKRELRKMYRIYENAYCTVALVPDVYNVFFLNTMIHEYFKRLWTLEEALKSKRLLFVGKDRHQWGENTESYREIHCLIKSSSEINVSQILYHAHQRRNTKEHDRVFALIHLFPEFINTGGNDDEQKSLKKWIFRLFCCFTKKERISKKIKIDYNQPLEDLMIKFYGLLAKKDIRILLFGYNPGYKSTIKKYKFLPSWTGVNGMHTYDNSTISFQNYDVVGKTMHVASTYTTNNQFIGEGTFTLREEDLPPSPDDIDDDNNRDEYCLCILVQLPESSETKRIKFDRSYDYLFVQEKGFDEISTKLQQLSRFMEIKKENLCWCHRFGNEYRMATEVYFHDLTDGLDDPTAQYVILSEISFESDNNRRYYPVIKKLQGEEFYKAIGCCKTDSEKDFFSDCNLSKETFLIQ